MSTAHCVLSYRRTGVFAERGFAILISDNRRTDIALFPHLPPLALDKPLTYPVTTTRREFFERKAPIHNRAETAIPDRRTLRYNEPLQGGEPSIRNGRR